MADMYLEDWVLEKCHVFECFEVLLTVMEVSKNANIAYSSVYYI